MSFPVKRYADVATYSAGYFRRIAEAAERIDGARLAAAADLLTCAFRAGRQLFLCGNGGSAAISNHMMCDFAKGIRTDTGLLPRIQSLSANLELITAIANDIDYADCFVFQLKAQGCAGDVLTTVSASGDSENVFRAMKWARANGLRTIALTGFSGGRTAELAEINLHIEADNYGVIEDMHQSLLHILAQFMRMTDMSAELVEARKF